MSAPRLDTCTWTLRNPHAKAPLRIPIAITLNTPDEEIRENVRINTARDLPWLAAVDAHDSIALMVGGGPSTADHIEDIRRMAAEGATVFAMNAASQYLRSHGIAVDWQVTCDAKTETAGLIDPLAKGHLLASHVNPLTMNAVPRPTVWHSYLHVNEEDFPKERVKRGGYALLGGEASTGLGALCVAYCLGFRRLEIFGYDSCHRENQSHAYRQKMNDTIPAMQFEWAGRTFFTSITMRTQAERFPITGQALVEAGATLNLWGDGLLQHIWRTPPALLSERDKYVRMWQDERYREVSPGEGMVDQFVDLAKPEKGATIIDFGCGTGRAGLALDRLGYEVTLVDFVSFSRDQEAHALPFFEWDLSRPCPLRAEYGMCCDVLEHIPPEHVDDVINSVMGSAKRAFFQIATRPDTHGPMVLGLPLHLTVEPHQWWRATFDRLGFATVYEEEGPDRSVFFVRAVEPGEQMEAA